MGVRRKQLTNPGVSRRKVHDDVALCAARRNEDRPHTYSRYGTYARDERRKVQER